MPIARPRSPGGYTEVRMASAVAKVMAPARPWATRKPISAAPLGASAQARENRVCPPMPRAKTRRRPKRSAALPKGTRLMAAASR